VQGSISRHPGLHLASPGLIHFVDEFEHCSGERAGGFHGDAMAGVGDGARLYLARDCGSERAGREIGAVLIDGECRHGQWARWCAATA
jgi:hypothetical protein